MSVYVYMRYLRKSEFYSYILEHVIYRAITLFLDIYLPIYPTNVLAMHQDEETTFYSNETSITASTKPKNTLLDRDW